MTDKPMTSKQYRVLFNAVSDTIQNLDQMKDQLKAIQMAAEDLCIDDSAAKEPMLFARPPGAYAARGCHSAGRV